MGKWARAWRLVSNFETVRGLLDLFGLKITISTLMVVIFAILGSLSSLPPPVIGLIVLAAVGATLFVLNEVDIRKRRTRLTGNAITSLLTLRSEGTNKLLNRSISSEQDLSQWKGDFVAWEKKVINELKGVCRQTQVAWFMVIVTFTPKNLGGWSPEHAFLRDVLAEKLDRLLKIIERLEEEPHKRRS